MYKIIAVRLLLLLLAPFSLFAQFTYRLDQSIPVSVNEVELKRAWAGGLNSPQVSMMDLDLDGKEDVVIFDKSTAQIRTFRWVNDGYEYAPQYEALFPSGLSTFVLLRDYDCDGKKDLFTFGQIGILVYQQVAVTGKPFGWKKLSFYNSTTGLFSEVLLTKGFTSKINLLPGTNDLPDFTDMDGDGDLDVLNMRFVSPGTAEYHRNFSMERYGTCDSLDLERQTSNWGGFLECSCGKVAFQGQTCADIGGRTNHNGGKALLSLDTDGDGDRDLLFNEEACSSLYGMENLGTTAVPVMDNLSLFPSGAPVSMPSYPAPYYEDVDHDGKKDLLVGLNVNVRTEPFTDFGSSLWRYRNTGTTGSPVFVLEQFNFLQDGMIEVGDLSAPAVADIDNDGDLDLFVGTFLNPVDFRGGITFYRNTGSPQLPYFEKVTDDFANVSYTSIYNVRPQFADLDKNGSLDLLFTGTVGGNTRLWYILAAPGSQPSFEGQNLAYLDVPMGSTENATVVDVDLDGHLDVLVGKSTGALYYYRNTGASTAFVFSLSNDEFLGLGSGTSRQNLAVAVGDLDSDGKDDLLTGDQAGTLEVYSDFRSGPSTAFHEIVFDTYSESYFSRNMGGNAKPVVGNVLNVNRPSIIVGNRQGGLHMLHHDNSIPMSESPQVSLSPNPAFSGGSLYIFPDRDVTVEIFSLVGARLTEGQAIPANQSTEFPIRGLAPGLYLARFTAGSKATAVRFVVL